MFVQDRVIIEQAPTPCVCRVCDYVCVCGLQSADGPVFFFFIIQSESFHCGRTDLTCRSSLSCKTPFFFISYFLCETRHLMLLGCMLEYLKGKTHEQEEKPYVGFPRSLFVCKLIHFIKSKQGLLQLQLCFFY